MFVVPITTFNSLLSKAGSIVSFDVIAILRKIRPIRIVEVVQVVLQPTQRFVKYNRPVGPLTVYLSIVEHNERVMGRVYLRN